MRHKILILGRAGAGKSFSLYNLPPETTGVINIDKKELPWPHSFPVIEGEDGWTDLSKSNYVEVDKFSQVEKTLNTWKTRKDIDTIVIDTITHLITSDYIHNAIGRNFAAYQNMGKNVYMLLDQIRELDKNVIVFGHIDVSFNDMGDKVIKMRSQGKMIDGFEPESYFSVMLFSEFIKQEKELKYVFRTRPADTTEKIKSPARMTGSGIVRALEEHEPNDVQGILTKLNEFYKDGKV